MIKRQGIETGVFFCFLLFISQRLINVQKRSARRIVILEKAKIRRLAKSQTRYEESKIPKTLLKIYPLSVNFPNNKKVIGVKIVPITKIVNHQLITKETSDINHIIDISWQETKTCYNFQTMSKKKVRIGVDFDGVLAYNPFRVIRYPVSVIKKLMGKRELKFFYPRNHWQRIFWQIVHESSIFPAKGTKLLKKLYQKGNCELHLITARFSFLDHRLYRWLEKNKLREIFQSININKKDEQPHIFKEKAIKRLKLHYYIEDNLDIVRYINQKSKNKNQKTKIFWIYNILDRNVDYQNKFPYLEKALKALVDWEKIDSK